MAPRKRVGNTAQKIEEKKNKKGRKKIIHGNAPSIIRVEIPSSSSPTSAMKTSKARVVTSQKLKTPTASSNKIMKSKLVTAPNFSKNEIKVMLANEVVEAQFKKKSNDNECKAKKLPTKRKITPKKMMDGRIANLKKMKFVDTDDSDDSDFEGQTESKQRKSKSKRLRKVRGSPITPDDADILQNSAVNTNPKMKKKLTQNHNINTKHERQLRIRIVNVKKKTNTDICDNKNMPLTQKESEEGSKIPERVRKLSSTSETLSWTKDVSSSSTATCITVSTNEYVCLDNRVPMIKLTNIDNQLDTENSSGKTNESPIDKRTNDNKNVKESCDNGSFSPTPFRSRSLSLSSSTSSSCSNSGTSSNQSIVTKKKHDTLNEALDKLTSNLREFDTEIMKWIGYENENCNRVKRNFQGKVFEVLKEEGDVITMCRNIKKLLLDDSQYDFSSNNKKDSLDKDEKNEDSVKPDIAMELKSVKEKSKTETTIFKNINDESETKTVACDSFDDDDALSLYAESISGFDSSRKSTGISNEEYIPQPVSKTENVTQSVTYMPTKITDKKRYEDHMFCEPHQKTKSICEKQNADSTSIYKDLQYDTNIIGEKLFRCSDESASSDENQQAFQSLVSVSKPDDSKTPILMSSIYESIHFVKSAIFSGVCFFNLILSCKKSNCRFVHSYINLELIKHRLKQANEDMFVKEYMLMRNWFSLRRKYGLLFVNEAINRELTRIAIEMAMDFVTKTTSNMKDDVELKVEVLEQVLLYLNNVNILTYSDLLLYNIKYKECISDIFMETLAETQNFTRFKKVFVNLTNFMYKNNRQFSMNVATLVLERVCILPFDETLILALLNILRRSPLEILQNSMIPHLEKSLSSHEQLLMQLQEIKNLTLPSGDDRVVTPNPVHYNLDQTSSTILGETDKRCSPDTTNYDQLTKTPKDSIKSPAIDSNRAWLFDQNGGLPKEFPVSSIPLQNNSNEHQKQFQRWNDGSTLNKIIMISNTNAETSLMGPKRESNFKRGMDHGQCGESSTKYPRRFGPDIYRKYLCD